MDTIKNQIEPIVGSDPSSLTTQQLWREIAALKELITSQLESLDKAVQVAHEDLVRVPTDVQEAVRNLKEVLTTKIEGDEKLQDQKFGDIEKRFDIIEGARREQKTDTSTALTNALNAAKEAVQEQNKSSTQAIDKSEKSTLEQIGQLRLSINQITKALEDKIDDLKDKVNKIENIAVGVLGQKATQQTSSSSTVNILGLIIGTLIAIAGIVIGVMKSTG